MKEEILERTGKGSIASGSGRWLHYGIWFRWRKPNYISIGTEVASRRLRKWEPDLLIDSTTEPNFVDSMMYFSALMSVFLPLPN